MRRSFSTVSLFLLGFVLSTSGCDWGTSADKDCTGPNCGGDQFVNFDDSSKEILPADLSPADVERIDILRSVISNGLQMGQVRFLETISLGLQSEGLADDYESVVEDEGLVDEDINAEPEDCPFVKYYENGFVPNGVACEYLVDLATTEAYSELTQVLGETDPMENVEETNLVTHDEAVFWLEQGAVSGIEENRVLVRGDIKKRGYCDKAPTPIESSYDKGVLVGRKLFAEKVNNWLVSKGMVGDYPNMQQQVQVCNASQTMLEPAQKAAVDSVEAALVEEPLCDEFEPDGQDDALNYFKAKDDYKKGVHDGISDEFEIATVKIFKLIPCALSSPIVIDLDGDGVELTQIHQGVNFDLWGTKTPHAMSWVGKDDGFLVRDLNGNGTIDNGMEMFGNINNGLEDGFEMLAQLDSDGNGAIDAADKDFAGLRIWKDNGNGITEAGELIGLDTLGLKRISLATEAKPMVIAGNVIYEAVWVDLNGKKNIVVDAFLRTAPHASSVVSR